MFAHENMRGIEQAVKENGIEDTGGGAKRLRGLVKLFFPYFMQAAYIRRKYGVDVTPKWYNRESFLSRIFFMSIQLLPYGLIGPRSVVVAPSPVSPNVSRQVSSDAADADVAKQDNKAGASAAKAPVAFTISALQLEIFNDRSITDELIDDIHARVLEGLYPETETENIRS